MYLSIYEGKFGILLFNCICNETLLENDEKIKMGNHLSKEGRARGAGQAYAHPPLPLSAALDPHTEISLKILRLK